jgi:hypothetical protein
MVAFSKSSVDIKFTIKGRCFHWRVYDKVVKVILGVKSLGEKCPRRGAAMGIWHRPDCGFSSFLL